MVLLGTALFHGFYGLRTILTEWWTSKGAARVVNAGCWLIGVALFVIGTVAALTFHVQLAAL